MKYLPFSTFQVNKDNFYNVLHYPGTNFHFLRVIYQSLQRLYAKAICEIWLKCGTECRAKMQDALKDLDTALATVITIFLIYQTYINCYRLSMLLYWPNSHCNWTFSTGPTIVIFFCSLALYKDVYLVSGSSSVYKWWKLKLHHCQQTAKSRFPRGAFCSGPTFCFIDLLS